MEHHPTSSGAEVGPAWLARAEHEWVLLGVQPDKKSVDAAAA
jgi:hypothetical protein